MQKEQQEIIVQLMKTKGIVFEQGLTDEEISDIEKTFGFAFPSDLQAFLQAALPVSEGFVNWRAALVSEGAKKIIADKFSAPLEGILFDIQNNGFWYESWGAKPETFSQQKKTVEKFFQQYSKLIPVYFHRYIPAEPHEADNPVFSVWQTDVICYGENLAVYFRNEFQIPLPTPPEKPKHIEFWSDLIN